MTNGSVSFSVAQAMALETEGLKVTVPTGDLVTLSDTAANIEKLTATQIAGLAAIGVTAIAATNASVSLTVAQTSAVNTARLLVSAPANDAVTEHNADGSYDIVYSGITGQAYSSYQSDYNSAGVLIAKAVNDTNGAGVTTVYGNNLKISTSAGAESLTVVRIYSFTHPMRRKHSRPQALQTTFSHSRQALARIRSQAWAPQERTRIP